MPQPTIIGAYCGVETLKRASNTFGADRDALILQHLNAASRAVEQDTKRAFFPYIATNLYRWPTLQIGSTWALWVDTDLLTVTTLQAAAQNSNPVAITHYFLEPQPFGPPYSRIEIDLSSSDVFQSGNTPQRSISVLGQWGYGNDTASAGTLAAAISSTSATTLTCSDASKIDQGDLLLIESEAIYVAGRAAFDTTATTTGTLAQDKSVVTVPLSSGVLVNPGEIILIDSESMYVQSVTGNTATVIRAFDGTVLASHSSGVHVYAGRTLTIQRGVNGTTAATHSNSTAISRYQPPADIRNVVKADAIASLQQDYAGWGRVVGAGDMAVEFNAKALKSYREGILENYTRLRSAAI